MNTNQQAKTQNSITQETQFSTSISSVSRNEPEMPTAVVGGIGDNKYLLVKCRGWWVKSACQI